MRTTFFRNVYIDSEINAIGSGQASRIQFPSTNFSIKPNQMMKLVLTTFEMRRNWYSVNSTNNTFYLYNHPNPGDYTEINIPPGSYRSFSGIPTTTPAPVGSLAEAIGTAISAIPGVTATVTWSDVTRKFSIVLAGASATAYFVCFQVKQNPPAPTGVDDHGYFNDSAEILGAKPTRDNWGTTPRNAFGTTVGNVTHISPYVGALNTIETIFIRTNLQTNNYQSYGFEKNLPNSSGLTASSIFARIPLSRAYYNDEFEIIQFEDPDEIFTILLQQQQLSEMTFAITDHAGRSLAEVNEGQALDGNLSFKLSFRWEVVEQETPQGEYRIRPPPLQNVKIQP